MAEPLCCDVLVAGGGLVGATLACALATSTLRVCVVEAAELAPIGPADPLDPRVSALTRASERLLRNLALWERIPAERTSAFREMHVWDATGSGAIHFDSAWIGEPCLGYILENRLLLGALRSRLSELSSVRWLCPQTVMDLIPGSDAIRVLLAGGQEVLARVVVAADGSDSRVRRLAQIPVRGAAYPQKALIAAVSTALPHRETAWQRFLPSGPLALLPTFDGRCSIVWSTDPRSAEELLRVGDDEFCARLEEASQGVLGTIEGVEGRSIFALRRQHAPSYLGSRVVLVGDAAHTVHPLAGQGVNLGLLDAAALAEVLADAAALGRDVGSRAVLRRYERWRKGQNLAMLLLMDGFRELFGSPWGAVRRLRNLGLHWVDMAGPLKRQIMLQASGLQGDLPRLARLGA